MQRHFSQMFECLMRGIAGTMLDFGGRLVASRGRVRPLSLNKNQGEMIYVQCSSLPISACPHIGVEEEEVI